MLLVILRVRVVSVFIRNSFKHVSVVNLQFFIMSDNESGTGELSDIDAFKVFRAHTSNCLQKRIFFCLSFISNSHFL